jgi:hypothetical protein
LFADSQLRGDQYLARKPLEEFFKKPLFFCLTKLTHSGTLS